MAVVFESETLIVTHTERGGDAVVVSFSPMDFLPGAAESWGDAFFEKLGVTVVGFVAKQKDWYPSDTTLPAIVAAIEAINGRRAITYGYSMGAYAALKFSRALNASHALAFSPQVSIDPAVVGDFDTRYAAYFDPVRNNGAPVMPSDLCANAYAMFDPGYAEDALNARALEQVGVQCVPMHFVRHDTIQYMIATRATGGMVRPFIASPDAGRLDIRRAIRAGRTKSPEYAFGRIRCLLERGRPGALLDAAIDATEDADVRALYDACRAHLQVLAIDPPAAGMLKLNLFELLEVFGNIGFTEGLRVLSRQFAAKHPTDAVARLNGAAIMLRVGDAAAARTELDAIKLLSSAEPIMPQIEHFRAATG